MPNINSSNLIASDYFITTMNGLASYARLLCQAPQITYDQQKVFIRFANEFEEIILKWKNGLGRCLSRADIDVLHKFRDLLTRRSYLMEFVTYVTTAFNPVRAISRFFMFSHIK